MKSDEDLMQYTEMAMKGLALDDDMKQGYKSMTDIFLTCYEESKLKGHSHADSIEIAGVVLKTMLFPNV
ncbi:hypothetical protein [Levilactobacillus enshiensis]|uniref:hypothetical protein n=1 Tax=Levilactobacillus enshiensis TaxID=2590213 RepID=UPI00117A2B50|nr:hypothetical protein [Levilactobacillus enshiensis]